MPKFLSQSTVLPLGLKATRCGHLIKVQVNNLPESCDRSASCMFFNREALSELSQFAEEIGFMSEEQNAIAS